jgi:hypothetical protein
LKTNLPSLDFLISNFPERVALDSVITLSSLNSTSFFVTGFFTLSSVLTDFVAAGAFSTLVAVDFFAVAFFVVSATIFFSTVDFFSAVGVAFLVVEAAFVELFTSLEAADFAGAVFAAVFLVAEDVDDLYSEAFFVLLFRAGSFVFEFDLEALFSVALDSVVLGAGDFDFCMLVDESETFLSISLLLPTTLVVTVDLVVDFPGFVPAGLDELF